MNTVVFLAAGRAQREARSAAVLEGRRKLRRSGADEEFAGYTTIAVADVQLLVTNAETPTIQRFAVSDALEWEDRGRVSLLSEGVTDSGFYRQYMQRDKIAYAEIDVAQRALWDPVAWRASPPSTRSVRTGSLTSARGPAAATWSTSVTCAMTRPSAPCFTTRSSVRTSTSKQSCTITKRSGRSPPATTGSGSSIWRRARRSRCAGSRRETSCRPTRTPSSRTDLPHARSRRLFAHHRLRAESGR
jgi:hypothetical protein